MILDDSLVQVEPRHVLEDAEYNPTYCHKALQYMARGHSLRAFSGHVMIPHRKLEEWVEKFPEFRDAVEIAIAISLGKWEEIALDQATGEVKGNSSTLAFMMKNMFPKEYKDKVNVETEGNLSFIIDTGVPNKLIDRSKEDNEGDDVEAEYTNLDDYAEEDEEGWEGL